jgi:negative regulator of flagellin synthesis FlgM
VGSLILFVRATSLDEHSDLRNEGGQTFHNKLPDGTKDSASKADKLMELRGAHLNHANGIGSPRQHLDTMGMSSPNNEGKAQPKLVSATQSASRNAFPTDEVQLNPATSVAAQALWGSDVRTERVEALRHAIAMGMYNVSSSDLAGKLITALLK